MKSLFLSACLGLSLAFPISAQDAQPTASPQLEAAIQRREAARAQLAQTNAEVLAERATLQETLQPLEEEVSKLRDELLKLQREADNFESFKGTISRNVEGQRITYDYATGQTMTYASGIETRLNPAELKSIGKTFAEINDKIANADQDESAKIAAGLSAVREGLDRISRVTGGSLFEGRAEHQGKVIKGTYALIGPSAYFAAADGSLAGLTTQVTGDPLPKLVPLEGDQATAVTKLTKGEEATIPLDPMLGFGLKAETSKETIMEHLEKGGVVGYAIVGLGLIALVLAIFKFIEISALKAPRVKHINKLLDFLEQGKRDDAIAYGKKVGGAAGKMIKISAERYDSKRRVLEELLFEQVIRLKPKAERFLPFLAVTASAAPLMGLLGTVMGMIKTFKVITEQGTSDAKNLAGGISEALVTTELGLVVAIPTLILHGVLKRQAKEKLGLFESAGLSLLNGLNDIDDANGRSDDEDPTTDDDGGSSPADSEKELQPA